MDETPPDGSAATLVQIAATLQPLTTPVVVLVLLMCGSFPGALFLLGLLTWAIVQITAAARPASRALLRGTLLAALASLPLAIVLPDALQRVDAPPLAAAASMSALAGVWLLHWLAVWRFTRRRVTDAGLRRGIDGGFVQTGLLLLLAAALPWLVRAPATLGAMMVVLGMAGMLLAGRAVRAVRGLWPLAEALPADCRRAICAHLADVLGLEGDGEQLTGSVDGIAVQVRVDTSTMPAVTTIRAALGATSPRLRVRSRAPGEDGGRPLADPLLGRLLFIEGLPDAALLDGLHEELLGVLHAWPGSALEGGTLRVQIPGPPFSAERLGEAPLPDDAAAMAGFLARRVGEAVALAQALHARSSARGTARRHQPQRTPEHR